MLLVTASNIDNPYFMISQSSDQKEAANEMLQNLMKNHGYFKDCRLAFLEDHNYKDEREGLIAVVVNDDVNEVEDEGMEYAVNTENGTRIFVEEYNFGDVKPM